MECTLQREFGNRCVKSQPVKDSSWSSAMGRCWCWTSVANTVFLKPFLCSCTFFQGFLTSVLPLLLLRIND